MNILITRHDKIGDFILTLPMIKIAKKNIQSAKITLLVSKVNYEFAKRLDFVDNVILYDKDIFALVSKIKKERIDVSISAYIDPKIALILFLSGIKYRYAPATKIAQLLFNRKIKQRRSRVKKREFEYNIDLLKGHFPSIKDSFTKPLLVFSEDQKRVVLDRFKKEYNITNSKKIVGFHPGYGGSSDGNISTKDYLSLAKSISSYENIQIVFTFGPDDKESLEYIKNSLDFDAICFCSNYPLYDFCTLLSSFELLISTSTGPMHLVGAVNIKTISFFGDSLFASDRRWGSISDISKQNNFTIGKNYSRREYEKVLDRLKSLLLP